MSRATGLSSDKGTQCCVGEVVALQTKRWAEEHPPPEPGNTSRAAHFNLGLMYDIGEP